jgi:hypothetical protein
MDKKKALRLTLGIVAVAGGIASSNVLMNRPAEQEVSFAKVELVADVARLAVLQASPAPQTHALAELGFKDMTALRLRVEAEKQELQRAAIRAEHEAQLVFGVVLGSLIASSLAGIALIRDSLRSRCTRETVAAA